MKRQSKDEVEHDIKSLDGLDTKALQVHWRELFKRDPPARMRAGFLRRGISYRLQERAFGGLKPQTVRLLRRLAGELTAARASRTSREPDGPQEMLARAGNPRPTLSPGTQLMREWNGTTEVVEVSTQGFVWKEKTYRTLTAVAVAITGTKWSGPKFFGLLPSQLPKTSKPMQRKPTERRNTFAAPDHMHSGEES